jgi:hypothetical protein
MARVTDYGALAYRYYLSRGIASRCLYNTCLYAVVLFDLAIGHLTSMPKATSIAPCSSSSRPTAQGRATLTQLGRDISDKAGSERARCDAFLSAELFRALYEQNKGNVLPPPAAIERQMDGLGVSPKQRVRARQTFMKSAHYAGFLDPSSGRFIKPGTRWF